MRKRGLRAGSRFASPDSLAGMGRAGPARPGVSLSLVPGPCGRPASRPGIAASRGTATSPGIAPPRAARSVARAPGVGRPAAAPARAVVPAGAVLLGRAVRPGGVPGRGRTRCLSGAAACRRVRLRLRRPVGPSQGLAGGKLAGDILAGGKLAGGNLAGGSLAAGNLLSGHLVCGGLVCGGLLGRSVPRGIVAVGRDDADLGRVGRGSGEGA